MKTHDSLWTKLLMHSQQIKAILSWNSESAFSLDTNLWEKNGILRLFICSAVSTGIELHGHVGGEQHIYTVAHLDRNPNMAETITCSSVGDIDFQNPLNKSD